MQEGLLALRRAAVLILFPFPIRHRKYGKPPPWLRQRHLFETLVDVYEASSAKADVSDRDL